MRPLVFLDTTGLLKGFAAKRASAVLPLFVSDPEAERYTFEKCVFEAYMAFRGIGGKKPDEGRGRWAESHLESPRDPLPIGALASKFHQGNTRLAHFWINNIDGLRWGGLEAQGEVIEQLVRPDERQAAHEGIERLKELARQRHLYDRLCDGFGQFLEEQRVRILPYIVVFGDAEFSPYGRLGEIHPRRIDTFVRDCSIPSEDFEIVFAALRLGADVFVTDDDRLSSCAWSLGLNLPTIGSAFCRSADYEAKVREWRQHRSVTEQ